jgi:geranylgeranyl transferase type-2 subunit alpha
MFHGIKKSDVHKLTPEEEKKKEETLKKIEVIQNKILQIKSNPKADKKTLDFLFKSAILMSDYPTLWSLRKILLNKYTEENLKNKNAQFNLYKKEINDLFLIMKKDPKSYLLWFHRIWCLIKILEIEKEQKINLEESLINNEIELTNKFLLKDDRNFHVWNYRVELLSLINKYYNSTFQNFIEKELQFTLNKIQINFSNFSAWHYRTKLIPIYFANNNIKWNNENALNYFNNDLELLKKAFYTDPKDQSPWNYHYWIFNNFSPIYVEDINLNNNEVNVKYSNVFKIREVLNEKYFEILNKEEFNDCVNIKLNFNDCKEIIVKNKEIEKINFCFDGLSLIVNKICFTKENLNLPEIKFFKDNNNEIKYEIIMNNVEEFQKNFFKNQLEMIKELINNSKDVFIENAHLRLAQIYNIFYQIEKKDEFKELELNEYKILKEKSKRMKNMYKTILENFNKK